MQALKLSLGLQYVVQYDAFDYSISSRQASKSRKSTTSIGKVFQVNIPVMEARGVGVGRRFVMTITPLIFLRCVFFVALNSLYLK